MELPQFKLSLSGIYAKKDLSSSTMCDENTDPRLKVPLSERQDSKFTYTLSRKPDKTAKTPSPTSDLMLQIDDLKEDSELTNEEDSISLDNQEFHARHGAKRRMISRLDTPYERERKMSQTMSEFLKKSTEIQMELWGKQQDEADKSLFEGSIGQALSPHFPNGIHSHFLKESSDSESQVDKALLARVNECLIQRDLKQLEASQAANSHCLLQFLCDFITEFAPLPLGFTQEIEITSEEKGQFSQLFGRKALNCPFDEAVLKAVGYYHGLLRTMEEEVRSLQRELQSQIHISKSLERENKRNTKALGEKMLLLEKTSAELRSEKHHHEKSKEPSSDSSRQRSKSPIRPVPSNEATAVLEEICRILAVKHPHHILRSVSKLDKVVRAVPKLERFIREVCGYLCPTIKDEERKREYAADVDFLGKRMRDWSAELAALRGFRGSVCHMVAARAQTSDEELLSLLKHRETDYFEQHFRQVFELRDSQDAFEAAGQIFLQNHELRAFCRNVKQFLGVSEESSLSSLLLLVKQLKRR